MAALLPWDVLFVGGFVVAGSKAVGRWLKFSQDTSKRYDDMTYLKAFEDSLAADAAEGKRQLAQPGASAIAAGQSQVWVDWPRMAPRTRIALLMELKQVLTWTGQDAQLPALQRARGVSTWAALSSDAKLALLAVADHMGWGWVEELVQAGAQLADNPLVWQVSDPLPALSVEPAAGEEPARLAAALKEAMMARQADLAAAFEARQAELQAGLAPAQELGVVEVARKVAGLREAVQGGLGLGSGGKAARGQELLEALRGLTLTPADAQGVAAKEAAKEALAAEVETKVAPVKENGEATLVASNAAARHSSLVGALQTRIRGEPGRTPLAAAVAAAAVYQAAGQELVASLGRAQPEQSSAGRQQRDLVALMQAAAAAVVDSVSAPGGDAEAAAAGVMEQLAALEERLEACAAADQEAASAGEEASSDAVQAARSAVQQQLSEVEEAALAVVSAAQALHLEAVAGDGPAPEAPDAQQQVTEAAEAIEKEVVAAAEPVQQRAATILQRQVEDKRSWEGTALVNARIKALTSPPAAAAAEGEEATPSDPPPSPAARLVLVEQYLQAQGQRPLAGAVEALTALVEVPGGLAGGVDLEAGSAGAVASVERLLSEIHLCESVMKLELGAGLLPCLAQLRTYIDALTASATAAEQEAEGEVAEGSAEGDAAAAAARAMSPVKRRELEVSGHCKEIVTELESDGLVMLRLTAAQYKTLAQLRDSSAQLKPGADALVVDRAVRVLQEVSAALGPIGAAIQVRLAGEEDPAVREVLAEQKARATGLYEALTAFLRYQEEVRRPGLACIAELRRLASGLVAAKDMQQLQASILKAEFVLEEIARLRGLLDGQAAGAAEGSAVAAATARAQEALALLEAGGQDARAELRSYAGYVALRGRALNKDAAAAAADAADPEALGLPTLEEEGADSMLLDLTRAEQEEVAALETAGYTALARGQAALVTCALCATPAAEAKPGEEAGPRLRLLQPLGEAGLPSGKCLLQLLAERLLKVQALAAADTYGPHAAVTRRLQWAIMTADEAGLKEVTSHLAAREYYGLSSEQVHVFAAAQRGVPCFNEELKVVLSGATRLAKAPVGSGEVFTALRSSGVLGRLRGLGVRHLEVHACEDNLLARPLDPALLGYVLDRNLDAAAKVMEPDAAVHCYGAAMGGVLGAGGAVEDCEETQELAAAITAPHPAIGIYLFSVGKAQELAAAAADHPLEGYRLVPQAGIPAKPAAPATPALPPGATAMQRAMAAQAAAAAANAPPRLIAGYAPMRLVADVFNLPPLGGAAVGLLAVDAAQQWAPVWGMGPAVVVEEPADAVQQLLGLHTAWVEELGGHVGVEEGVEVSPLVSYAGEGLEGVVEGASFQDSYDEALQGAVAAATGVARSNVGSLALPLGLLYGAVCAVSLAKQLVSRG